MQVLLELRQEVRMMIGLPSDHDAVDMMQGLIDVRDIRNSTIDDNSQIGVRFLEPIDAIVL